MLSNKRRMTRYITVKEALRIHWRVIKFSGGSHGLRDLNLLESAIARPKAGFGKYEAYPDIFFKTAVLLHSLIKNHPFIDGNKRTGITTSRIFLKRNGYILESNAQKMVDFVLQIAKNQIFEEEIAIWLKGNSRQS